MFIVSTHWRPSRPSITITGGPGSVKTISYVRKHQKPPKPKRINEDASAEIRNLLLSFVLFNVSVSVSLCLSVSSIHVLHIGLGRRNIRWFFISAIDRIFFIFESNWLDFPVSQFSAVQRETLRSISSTLELILFDSISFFFLLIHSMLLLNCKFSIPNIQIFGKLYYRVITTLLSMKQSWVVVCVKQPP